MKKIIVLTISVAALMTACINSSTAWTNRSVVYQVTPENIGEHSAVSGSPTSNDSTVNAEKSYETSTKANVAQTLADNSSNDQSKNKDSKEAEAKQPAEDTPLSK